MSTKYTPESTGEPMFALVQMDLQENGYSFDEVIAMLGCIKEHVPKIRVERPNIATISVVMDDRVVAKYLENVEQQWGLHASPAFSVLLLHSLAQTRSHRQPLKIGNPHE